MTSHKDTVSKYKGMLRNFRRKVSAIIEPTGRVPVRLLGNVEKIKVNFSLPIVETSQKMADTKYVKGIYSISATFVLCCLGDGKKLPLLVVADSATPFDKFFDEDGVFLAFTTRGKISEEVLAEWLKTIWSKRYKVYFEPQSAILLGSVWHDMPSLSEQLFKATSTEVVIVPHEICHLVQPFNQGVLERFKLNFERLYEDWCANFMCETRGKVTIRMMCQWAKSAWNGVGKEQIVESFENVGIVNNPRNSWINICKVENVRAIDVFIDEKIGFKGFTESEMLAANKINDMIEDVLWLSAEELYEDIKTLTTNKLKNQEGYRGTEDEPIVISESNSEPSIEIEEIDLEMPSSSGTMSRASDRTSSVDNSDRPTEDFDTIAVDNGEIVDVLESNAGEPSLVTKELDSVRNKVQSHSGKLNQEPMQVTKESESAVTDTESHSHDRTCTNKTGEHSQNEFTNCGASCLTLYSPSSGRGNRQKPTACSHCNKQFSCKRLLDKHLQRHSCTLTYACEFCSWHYETTKDLLEHIHRQHS